MNWQKYNKHPIDRDAQPAQKYPLSSAGNFRHKAGQTDLVFGGDQGSLVGLCTQHYKAVTILYHPG